MKYLKLAPFPGASKVSSVFKFSPVLLNNTILSANLTPTRSSVVILSTASGAGPPTLSMTCMTFRNKSVCAASFGEISIRHAPPSSLLAGNDVVT
ncbi:hypothetical protein D3C73_558440 [compost metagenome]